MRRENTFSPPCVNWSADRIKRSRMNANDNRQRGYRSAGMDVGALLEWYERVRRPLPWRSTRDPYALLVSEVMLQQTQALRVVPYYERWLARFPDPPSLAAAPTRDVLSLWSGLGYNR